MRFFPDAFEDERYLEWEHDYKWAAHKLFKTQLGKSKYKQLLEKGDFKSIARIALQVESGTTFLFSFEKMALRDALALPEGARNFSFALYQLLYGSADPDERFVSWIVSVSELPRKKSRVLSWPILTLFPYIAQPEKHIVLKPNAMLRAARELDYDLDYSSKPNLKSYKSLLDLADQVGAAIQDLKPRNYHDLQTFLWTIGSPEYDRLEEELL